jgi:hypothetical protein
VEQEKYSFFWYALRFWRHKPYSKKMYCWI